jgi:ABC-type lipoprotein export system ATPase subunit
MNLQVILIQRIQKFFLTLFFKLRDDYNCSVVIVTHNESNANICDRKLLIVDGEIKN